MTVKVFVVTLFVPAAPDPLADNALEQVASEKSLTELVASERVNVTTGVTELFGDAGLIDV